MPKKSKATKKKAVKSAAGATPQRADRIEIIYQPIGELHEYVNNARMHPPAQITALMASIRTVGFITPVLVNAEGEIIAGHARVRAAAEVGMTSVPTVRLEHLDERQVAALRLTDNRITELGFWNPEILTEEMESMRNAFGDEFDVGALGFTDEALGELTNGAWSGSGEGVADGIDIPPSRPHDGPTKTCPKCGHQW